MKNENIVLVINKTDEPVRKRHISYHSRVDANDVFVLYEVSECFYVHPESNGQALVGIIEVHEVARHRRNSAEGSALHMHYLSERAASLVLPKDSRGGH